MREYPGSTLYQYTAKRFGERVRLVEHIIAVGTTTTQILNENPRRLAWMVCNRVSDPGAISFRRNFTFGEGLYVAADGGVVSMEAEEDGEAVGYAVYAINNTVSGNWWVMEIYTV